MMDGVRRNGQQHVPQNNEITASKAGKKSGKAVTSTPKGRVSTIKNTLKRATFSGKKLTDRKVKKMSKNVKSSVKDANNKKGAVKGFLKRCVAGLAGVAAGVGTFLATSSAAIVTGGLIGGLIGGPIGLLAGGIVGALVGGGAGIALGAVAGSKVSDKAFSHLVKKGTPHKQQWMKQLMGQEVIKLLTKKIPTAHDIRKIEEAVDRIPEMKEHIRNSDKYNKSPKKQAYYEAKFQESDDIISEYVRFARKRAFPKIPTILKEWDAEPNKKQADQQLEKIVDHFVIISDRNSISPLLYLRDEIERKLVVTGASDVASGLIEDIDQRVRDLLKMPVPEHYQKLNEKTSEEIEAMVSSEEKNALGANHKKPLK